MGYISRTYKTPIKSPTALLFRDYWTPMALLSRLLSRLLQDFCQETVAKMLQYSSFLLRCTIILGVTTYYLYSLINMAKEIIDDLVLLEASHNPPKSEVKRQKLIECVLTGAISEKKRRRTSK